MREVLDFLNLLLPFEHSKGVESDIPEDSVVNGLPDNEYADEIFQARDWQKVDIDALLAHPTSVWFLSQSGLNYYMPSIVVAALVAISERNFNSAIQLFDHIAARMDREVEPNCLTLSRDASLLFSFLQPRIEQAKVAEDAES